MNSASKNTVMIIANNLNFGGTERVISNLSNELVKQNKKVSLAFTYFGGIKKNFLLSKKIKTYHLKKTKIQKYKYIPLFLKKIFYLSKLINKIKPKVILSFLTNVNVLTLLATWKNAIPVIVSERSYPPNFEIHWLLKKLRRWLYPRAAAVVVLTKKTNHWLKREIPKAKGVIIPNPIIVPLPKFGRILKPSEIFNKTEKFILTVGRLEKSKGMHILVKVFQSISKEFPKLRLVVIGDGPDRYNLEKQCQTNNAQNKIYFFKQIGNISDWYKKAVFFVSASIVEGFPNAILEAVSHGCPVVSYDCDTGPSEIIKNNYNGMLVRPTGNEVALQKALKCILRKKSLLKKFKKNTKIKLANFNKKKVFNQWIKQINRCI